MTKHLTKLKDKLIRRVGCKPRKNTFYAFVENKANDTKRGYSVPFFLWLFCCLLVLFCDCGEQSSYFLLFVVCICVLLRSTLICNNDGNRNMKRNIKTINYGRNYDIRSTPVNTTFEITIFSFDYISSLVVHNVACHNHQ